uniref:M23 family peptidase n=1 Tax=Globodera pallida TaxID=36090 RepID=A0A183CCT3_GLOPA
MMNDLYCFNSVKLAVVFILMLLLSATLKAQRNEIDEFFDLMTAVGEHLGGEFNDAEKALKLDLNVNPAKKKLLNSLEKITKF